MSSTDGPDLTEFFKYSRPKRPPCKVAWALTQIKAAEKDQFVGALDTDKGIIPAGAVVEWLSKRDIDLSHQHIVNHRSKKCTCYDA